MNPFKQIELPKIPRSHFNLSHSKLMDADMGICYPVMCDETIPGDFWKISSQIIARMRPAVAPILHQVDFKLDYFHVPYRLLMEDNDWADFISGGVDGDYATPLPEWNPGLGALNHCRKGALWDYLGFPVQNVSNLCQGRFPIDFPRRAYYKIWNDYYRDNNLQEEIDIYSLSDSGHPMYDLGSPLMHCAWEKDYFTSAQLHQQRGIAPALPLAGLANVKVDSTNMSVITTNPYLVGSSNASTFGHIAVVDLSTGVTASVNDQRTAFQIQKFLERNQRVGVRYKEFLKGHFDVYFPDDTAQRPTYIGGLRSPLIVSEVLQTSSTTSQPSPLGAMGGHGISVNTDHVGKYHVCEFGLIMGILRIIPKPMYQQGLNRQWLRKHRYEFPFPEFAHLSEQAVETVELYATTNATDNASIFGYIGRYDECRYKPNLVVGSMRDTFNSWHLSRVFGSIPVLNSDFITCTPRKDFLAVQDEPAFLISIGNIISAVRPLPVVGTPGLIDHN